MIWRLWVQIPPPLPNIRIILVDTSKCHFFYNGPFSQWYTSPFKFQGETFNTAEQFMMLGKAVVFEDFDVAHAIMRTQNPSEQKKLGRKVRGYDDDVWIGHGYGVVLLGNLLKFTQCKEVGDYIAQHPDVELFVEASPYDKKWGIGLGMNDDRRFDFNEWDGENLLGQVITDVRNFLKGDVDDAFFASLDDAREVFIPYFE